MREKTTTSPCGCCSPVSVAYSLLLFRAASITTTPHHLTLSGTASGDIRHLVRTVNLLPPNFHQPLHVDMNDQAMIVFARNTIMLLVLMTTPNTEAAVTTVLHLWYSSRITPGCTVTMGAALHLVERILEKVRGGEKRMRGPPRSYRYTHKFGRCSMTMDYTAKMWLEVAQYFQSPRGMTAVASEKRRCETMTSSANQDYRDLRFLLRTIPGWAPTAELYRTDGILLPLDQCTREFTRPNPTLTQADCADWPTDAMADPLAGWPLEEVFATESAAKNDIYGKLYHYVCGQLAQFHQRLSTTEIHFEIFAKDVSELGPYFRGRGQEPYDRIEVSAKAPR